MIIIRSVLLDRAERELLQAAQVFIHVAYPRASDPLVPAGQGVPDDDPHLRVLRSLATNANDPVSYPRLLLAQQTLQTLAVAVTEQTSQAYWEAQVSGRALSETERQMSQVVMEERLANAPGIEQALMLITGAVDSLSVRDDPKWWNENNRGFEG